MDAYAPYTVAQGDARAQLGLLPAGTFQTCVCSPPYYRQRAYGTDPQIWDGDPECDHIWQETRRRDTRGTQGSGLEGTFQAEALRPDTQDATCTRCSAWRGELGLEPTPDAYIRHLVQIFALVRRTLRPDGTLFVNIGDSYASTSSYNAPDTQHTAAGWKEAGRRPNAGKAGLREKNLLLIPARLALALQADGWIIRNSIVWENPCAMPESVRDRWTASYETVIFASVHPRYYMDMDAVSESASTAGKVGSFLTGSVDASIYNTSALTGNMRTGVKHITTSTRNARDVWRIAPQGSDLPHYALMPPELARRCLAASTSAHGACSVCGAAWRRVVEKRQAPATSWEARKAMGHPMRYGNTDNGSAKGIGFASIDPPTIETTGWAPRCTCAAPVRPCWVLDPFAGAFTTGLVARGLGLWAYGIELNPAYAAMARTRLATATTWQAEAIPGGVDGWGDLPLFAAMGAL